jgi:hypothetical protein
MSPKFNPGPIIAAFICCIWPLTVHLLLTHWSKLINRINTIPPRVRNFRIGGR